MFWTQKFSFSRDPVILDLKLGLQLQLAAWRKIYNYSGQKLISELHLEI
jgi:hypothetical protein